MKSSLILGLASAHVPYLSLADGDGLAEQQVNTGVCQYSQGTWLFDLVPFDSMGSVENPYAIKQGDFDFEYKVCQPAWKATEMPDMTNTDSESVCGGSHMGYLGQKDGDNFNCIETFDYPTFLPIENSDADTVAEKPYMGFKLSYNTEDGDQKVTIDAICNKDAEMGAGAWEDLTASGETNDLQYKFTGQEACKIYDLDISKYFSGLIKFAGAISIILGLVLTFYGSKFIISVFGLLIFLLTQVVFWGILYNTKMFKPEEIEEKKAMIIGVGVVLFALGGVVAYYMARFADKYAVSLISGWVGGIIGFMFIGATPMPAPAKILIIAVLAGAAGYYSFKVQRYMKSAGTAIIGSFILFRGIGNYVGGYPEVMSHHGSGESDQVDAALEKMNDEEKGYFLFYLGGTIAFAVLGTWVQLTYVEKKKEEDEDFMKQEDA